MYCDTRSQPVRRAGSSSMRARSHSETGREVSCRAIVAATSAESCSPGLPRGFMRTDLLFASAAFKERFAAIGDEPAGGTPEEFADTIAKDSAKWRDVVKRSGAKLD